MKLTEDNYTELAEKVIVKLSQEKRSNGKPVQMVTTSKIRKFVAKTADIYNDVVNSQDENFRQTLLRIKYMKIRFVYEVKDRLK